MTDFTFVISVPGHVEVAGIVSSVSPRVWWFGCRPVLVLQAGETSSVFYLLFALILMWVYSVKHRDVRNNYHRHWEDHSILLYQQ